MRLTLTLAVSAIILSGCATQPDKIKLTQSGYPEAMFEKSSVKAVKEKIIQGCDNRGAVILESSDNSVVCEKTMTGGDAVLAQVLIGNSYSTTPQQKVRFTVYPVGKSVKVSARQWVETQMAFGQIRQQELNSNAQFNDMQFFLNSLGGR